MGLDDARLKAQRRKGWISLEWRGQPKFQASAGVQRDMVCPTAWGPFNLEWRDDSACGSERIKAGLVLSPAH
nr:hypothetical protein CFP56_78119 [Quercus suber]